MADATEKVEGGKETAAAAKLPIVPLVMAMLVAVVLGAGAIGGVMYYLVKAGKLGGGSMLTKVEAKETPAPPKTHALVLEPILVNLQDAGGRAYLRLGLTLRVEDEPVVKGAKPKEEKAEKVAKVPTEAETAVRDTVITVLGAETGDALLAPDGKELLKGKLRAAMVAHNAEVKVTDLYFTEFLVQR